MPPNAISSNSVLPLHPTTLHTPTEKTKTTTTTTTTTTSSSSSTPPIPQSNMSLVAGFELIFRGLTTQPQQNNITECASLGNLFHAAKIPKISLSQYFSRILRYCQIKSTESTLIVALIYLYRIIAKCGKTFINPNTIHRLVIVSVVVASKFCDDFLQTNTFYARVGGVSVRELNQLESEFLNILDFELNVTQPEYLGYEKFVYLATQATTDTPILPSSPSPSPSSPSPSPKKGTPTTISRLEASSVCPSVEEKQPWFPNLSPILSTSLSIVGFLHAAVPSS